MANSNHSEVTEFILQGFSEHPQLWIPLFGCFLSLYMVALTGNVLIITAITFNSSLHSPMYFFLFNLATMDIICTSSILPKVLEGLLSQENTISYGGCMAQLYFLTWSALLELLLFTVMAYDRYVAICHPLHYSTMMSKTLCNVLAAGVWLICAFNSSINTGLMTRLSFCGPNVITHFFCEIPPLLLLSCTSTYINSVMTVLADAFYGFINYLLILVSYGFIISSILKIQVLEGKKTAFSTCSSHLTVLSMYHTPVFYAYISPVCSYNPERCKLAGVLYSMLSPILNCLIYTLRSKEVKMALGNLFPSFRN
ncbi:olfactory receptor 13A1-like [Trichosurus vulpecula]|uniref:olfactory receptor 13A1-like n=1 Tax=Trichosurus vulpecula TaxID=9337 RepID=UPI00186ABFD0|nr:olfactory receptor 13A1-like [Trichosurus vulpecula]